MSDTAARGIESTAHHIGPQAVDAQTLRLSDANGVHIDLPEGVLAVRMGAGANCSSAGSAIDVLFYTSVIASAIAVALTAAFPPRADESKGREAPNEPDKGTIDE
ncbi:MAG: hypothetical protein IPK82_05680 [Polyangiaceae bacterium]|nr:hypothetical protein [Polyangiaceae bacterium]